MKQRNLSSGNIGVIFGGQQYFMHKIRTPFSLQLDTSPSWSHFPGKVPHLWRSMAVLLARKLSRKEGKPLSSDVPGPEWPVLPSSQPPTCSLLPVFLGGLCSLGSGWVQAADHKVSVQYIRDAENPSLVTRSLLNEILLHECELNFWFVLGLPMSAS